MAFKRGGTMCPLATGPPKKPGLDGVKLNLPFPFHEFFTMFPGSCTTSSRHFLKAANLRFQTQQEKHDWKYLPVTTCGYKQRSFLGLTLEPILWPPCNLACQFIRYWSTKGCSRFATSIYSWRFSCIILQKKKKRLWSITRLRKGKTLNPSRFKIINSNLL